MKKRFFLFGSCLFLLLIGCKEQGEAIYNDFSNTEYFVVQGRTTVSPQGVTLISSAASVAFKAEGDSIRIKAFAETDAYGFIEIVVDGDYLGRYKVEAEKENSIVIPLPVNTGANVELYKATEAVNGGVAIAEIKAQKLLPIKREDKVTIEFIGDSITCGYGADTQDIPCDEGKNWFDQHTAYWAYGPRIARALGTDYTLSSVSGMGMYRNWNDEDQPVMPDVYETTALNGNREELWNFPIQPDIVSICLGTNDLSDGDGTKERLPFNREKYVENYINFVKDVYKRYPNTKVALLNSPMVHGEKNAILVACLEQVKQAFEGQNPIRIFTMDEVTPHGCDYHPDTNDHEKMANLLIPEFKEYLK